MKKHRVLLAGAAFVAGLGALGYWGIRSLNYPPQIHGPDTPEDFGLRFETIAFQSREDSFPLEGWLCLADESRGTVIFGHGYGGSKDVDLPVALWLTEAGFNTFLFDFRGHGRSAGHPVTLGYYEQRDLLGAVDVIRRRGEDRIGILGSSMGAAAAILAAAQEPAIRALVTDSGFATLASVSADRLVRDGTPPLIARAAVALALPISHAWVRYPPGGSDPVRFVGRIAPRPLLIMHGTEDTFIPVRHAYQLYAAAGEPKRLLLFPGATHAECRYTDPESYRDAVIGHFSQALAGLNEPVGVG